MRRFKVVLWLALVWLAVGAPLQAADETEAAKGAALQWLSLTDKADYGASWDQAAQFFKQQVPRATWVAQLQQTRSPLQGVVSRKLRSASAMTTLPNAPAGHYVVIMYDTSFAKQAGLSEVVTPMLDKDGKWHVAGYYIHPGSHP